MTVKKYTLYQHDKEIGLVYSNDPDHILEIWSDLKSVTDGIETPIWYLKERALNDFRLLSNATPSQQQEKLQLLLP